MLLNRETNNIQNEYSILLEEKNSINKNYGDEKIFRLIDIILSIIGMLITMPIMMIACIGIIIETPGNPFYTQTRVGYGGKYFNIIKLRSMKLDAEKDGAKWAEKDDKRVTYIGGVIRKTRIDEIPQLINVLKGDMSLIGPRPERPIFTFEFNNQIPGFVNRLCVKPGLTGWAQINGGYNITPKEKLELDMYYIQNRNAKLNAHIIVKTIKIIFTGDGAR